MVKRRIFYENRSVYKDGPPEVAAEKTADERALDQVKTLYEKAGLPETEKDRVSKEIFDSLKAALKTKKIDLKVASEALASGKAKHLSALVAALLKNPDVTKLDPALIESAEKELKLPEFVAMVKHKGAKDRAKLKGEAARERLKDELPELPRKAPLSKEDFIKKIDSGEEQHSLDPIKIAVKREKHQINADKWDHSSIDGLRRIYADAKKVLGPKKINTPFYKSLFATLANAADESTNHYRGLKDENYVAWFKNPIKYRENLMTLPAKPGGFWGGEQFVRAHEHLHYLQSEVLNSQDVAHVATLAKQEGMDSDPVATKVTDFFSRNLSKMQKAVKERDYATMGLYAVGIYALYKSIEKLSGGKDSKIRKWLLYGVAAYAGHRFLQNAGYDILKMTGFKDRDYEVAGTPFEIMDQFLKGKPEYKEYDHSVAFRVSEVKLTTMEKLLDKTNKKGDFFIHPADFPSIFPKLAKEHPFEMGLAERGLSDSEGMSNKKLTAAQREYIRVGKQLYLTAKAMRTIYEETLYIDEESPYHNIPYEQALKDPSRKFGKVRHLLWAARGYATPDAETPMFERGVKQAQEHLAEVFKGEEIVDEAMGGGHFSGTLKGFPVVFVKDGESYKVYLRNNYKDVRNPGNKFTKVPLKGPRAAAQASIALRAVDKRMEDLMAPLQNAGGRVLSKPTYVDSEWQTEVELPAAAEFGVATGAKRRGILKPREDGTGVVFFVEGTAVRINVDESIAKQYEAALSVVPKITSQREFHALKVFGNGRRLRLEDPTPGDKKLDLIIGKGKHKLEVTYDPGADKFSVDAALEAALVKNPAFRKEYIEALSADDHFELNKTSNELKELIKQSCPQGFLKYFFKSLSNSTLRGPLSGINTDMLSGSVPNNFTNMIVESTKQQAFHKLQQRLKGATDLATVETLRKDVLADLNTELKVVYDSISRENRRRTAAGQDWQRMEFMLKVVDKVRAAGSQSTQYTLARMDLENVAYKMNLPGLATASDANEASHHSVQKLMGVFTYYTAHLDDSALDSLTYPPKVDPAHAADPTKDPKLRGHYALNYLEYVKDRIANEAPKITRGKSLSPGLLPHPSDRRWNIDDFDTWLATSGNYDALDPLDNKPAFAHDLNDHKEGPGKKPKHTPLDLEYKRRLVEAKDMLMTHVGADLNIIELEKYLNNRSNDEDEIGLFDKYRSPSTGKVTSKIWEDTDSIAATAGTRRSVQIRLLNQKVNEFLDFVFNAKDPNSGNLRFFINKPGVWERIKKYYYKIKYKLDL